MTLTILPSAAQHREEDFALDPEVLAGLWRMEDAHFWHAARNRFIARALLSGGVAPPARFLEVGCGSGAVARALHARGYQVTGIDTAEVLVQKAHRRCPEARFVAGALAELDPALEPFDAVGFFDVLEHLEDPLALLQSALLRLRPSGLVLVTVPALMKLYTVLDELGGHKRRYEPTELAALLRSAGLCDIEERGIFRTIAPLLQLRRGAARGPAPQDPEARRRLILADLHIPAFPLNQLLELLCAGEARFGFQAALNRAAPTLLGVGRVPARGS